MYTHVVARVNVPWCARRAMDALHQPAILFARALSALALSACLDAPSEVRGRYAVDVEALAADGRLEGTPPRERRYATDLAHANYADTVFEIEPPKCVEQQRHSRHERRCEVVRVDRRRVVVVDWHDEQGSERVRLFLEKDGRVQLERGRWKLPLKRLP